PKNLLTGTDKSGNQVHVIGFHSAKEYRDPQSHAHIACCENQRPIGDPAYASISTHLGLEQSRRDDIESLGYVMLYFCRGSLPWQEHNAHKGEQLWNWVKEKKSSTSIEDLCFGLPPEFTDYLHYARSLDFDQEPDYAYLRGLFRAIFSREGFQYDYVFDWTWHEQQSTAHADCQAPSESATCNDDKIGCDSTDSMEASVTLAPQCAFAVENPGPMVYPTRALEAQGNGMVSELNMRPVSQEVHEDE
ncbi:serine/threonine protein kinase, partial [Exophiala xenobiotica]